MTDGEAKAKLEATMLSVQTVGEMHALIIDYTYVEIMEVYNQLSLEQRERLESICDRDTQAQITATFITSGCIGYGNEQPRAKTKSLC